LALQFDLPGNGKHHFTMLNVPYLEQLRQIPFMTAFWLRLLIQQLENLTLKNKQLSEQHTQILMLYRSIWRRMIQISSYASSDFIVFIRLN
jgi:hypothetical protein